MLDVVLRTCDHTSVHPERGDRFIVCDKTTLIKKCFVSLLNSIKEATTDYDIKLWILDDNSSDTLIEYLTNKCIESQINYEIVLLQVRGFNYSALKQFEYCRDKGRKWVYSVEDDYLHTPLAIKNMLIMSDRFEQMTNSKVAFRPDDDPFTYSYNNNSSKKPCKIFLGNDRHWRTCSGTHNTIFADVSLFKDYWELFASLAKFFKHLSINEDKTINMLWNDGVLSNGPIPLFSPIPSLAIHISQGNEPPFFNYKDLWESIKL